MTANEIRDLASKLGCSVSKTNELPAAGFEVAVACFEIAAQLAELNATLSVFRNVEASAGGGLCTAPES